MKLVVINGISIGGWYSFCQDIGDFVGIFVCIMCCIECSVILK